MTRAKCPHCTYATSPASIAAHVTMAHPDAVNVAAAKLTAARKKRDQPVEPVFPPLYEHIEPQAQVPFTREQWLMAGVECLRSIFVDAGFPIPSRVRVSVGWPGGRGKKSGVIGQCWPTDMAGDGLHHIFISPKLTDPIEVLATLAHELVHASVPKGSKHRGPFVKAAATLGLVAPWTATTAGPELRERLVAYAEGLGAYDHGGLTALGRQAVQGTRMRKVECSECGCVIRMTRKWIEDAGLPTCGCGGEMQEAS